MNKTKSDFVVNNKSGFVFLCYDSLQYGLAMEGNSVKKLSGIVICD